MVALRVFLALVAIARIAMLVWAVGAKTHQPADGPAIAAGRTAACPVRIAAIMPTGPGDPRRLVARTFAVVLADASGENHVSGTLWINASGQPYGVAFHARNALANDFTGRIDPIVVLLPRTARLEEAFVDRYGDGTASSPCVIAGDWPGAMTASLRDDMISRIGMPGDAGALAAHVIRNPDRLCADRKAPPITINAVVPSTPPEAMQKNITGDVDVLTTIDASSIPTDAKIQRSPSAILNAASLDAARASVFRTEIRNCRPIAAKYIFIVSYNEDRPAANWWQM